MKHEIDGAIIKAATKLARNIARAEKRGAHLLLRESMRHT